MWVILYCVIGSACPTPLADRLSALCEVSEVRRALEKDSIPVDGAGAARSWGDAWPFPGNETLKSTLESALEKAAAGH